MLQLGSKRGMPAVIGPVGIQYTDLGDGRIAVLVVLEMLLYKKEVTECHGQIQAVVQFPQCVFRHLPEPVKHSHIIRLRKYHLQRLRLLHSAFSGIYRVDAVFFYRLELRIRNCT